MPIDQPLKSQEYLRGVMSQENLSISSLKFLNQKILQYIAQLFWTSRLISFLKYIVFWDLIILFNSTFVLSGPGYSVNAKTPIPTMKMSSIVLK